MKCDKEYRLSYTEKARMIISRMSLKEKVYLMSGRVSLQQIKNDIRNGKHFNYKPYPAGGNKQLGIPELRFCDGARGVVAGSSTCFPVPLARGASFDAELEKRIGRAIAREIRAYGGNLFGGVCVNVPYNPGWGRSQEVFGEDPFHIGHMGSALVQGVQEENVIACIKHYAFNSMEISRFKVNISTGKRAEREVHLFPFKECVDTGAACVMGAYNRYKGVHCGHSQYLLKQVLKEEWAFDGFVISDFLWGIAGTVEAIEAGMDIEMCHTKYYGDKLVEAVKDAKVSEEKIDQAALRIIRTLLAFAEDDDREYSKNLITSRKHISLARETAEKSMTLMKNDDGILPFSKKETKRLALIGRLGDTPNTGDQGSSRVFPPYTVTVLEGLSKLLPVGEVVYYSGEDLEHSMELAQTADAVVLIAGYNHYDEGEYGVDMGWDSSHGGDRKESLGLHEDEIELIKAVGPLNKNSAAVLIGGNMIMIEEWKDSVSAILMAYYPGMEGGTAIARTLFGEVNPGGKLPFVVPYRENDLPQVDWDTSEQYYDYYHGYAKLEKEGIEPLLPYGFGLSYTEFEISNPDFSVEGEEVKAACDVENTGDRAGDEVVQLYVGFSNSAVDRPVKLLRGFKRVSLEVD